MLSLSIELSYLNYSLIFLPLSHLVRATVLLSSICLPLSIKKFLPAFFSGFLESGRAASLIRFSRWPLAACGANPLVLSGQTPNVTRHVSPSQDGG